MYRVEQISTAYQFTDPTDVVRHYFSTRVTTLQFVMKFYILSNGIYGHSYFTIHYEQMFMNDSQTLVFAILEVTVVLSSAG
jgi:hypothetical protein